MANLALFHHPPRLSTPLTKIKIEIPIIVDLEEAQYSSWVELLKIHCHACNILDPTQLVDRNIIQILSFFTLIGYSKLFPFITFRVLGTQSDIESVKVYLNKGFI